MKAVRPNSSLRRSQGSPRRTVLLLALGTLGSVLITASPDVTADGVVSGTVYQDANNNGVHDPAEPGVPGVIVAAGASSTLTNADGAWSMSLSGEVRVRVVTGWYRSQCGSLNCLPAPATTRTSLSKRR